MVISFVENVLRVLRFLECAKVTLKVLMMAWPLGEGAAKPGIEMARRDIFVQKWGRRDESCDGLSHKVWKWLERSIPPWPPSPRGDAFYGMYQLVCLLFQGHDVRLSEICKDSFCGYKGFSSSSNVSLAEPVISTGRICAL